MISLQNAVADSRFFPKNYLQVARLVPYISDYIDYMPAKPTPTLG